MRKRTCSVTASPPPLSPAVSSTAATSANATSRSLRSPHPTKRQHEMQAEDAVQSPPRKRRGVAVAAPMDRDKMTAATVFSVPPSRSSSLHVPPSSDELHIGTRLQPGSKRGRTDKRENWVDGDHQRGRRRDNEATLDGTAAAPVSPTSSVSTGTSRTLTYDVELPLLCPPRRNAKEVEVSPLSLLGSIATPARRNHLVLTSTPRFIREEREGVADGDTAAHTPSALLRTPMRLVRAARGLLSPASATLRRRLAYMRQSAMGTTSVGEGLQPQQQAAASSSSPLPPSPWGRLSSIVLDGDSFPSCVEEGGVGGVGDGGASANSALRRRGLAPTSAPLHDAATLSSIPISRRSSASASASDIWRRGSRDAELPGGLRSTVRPDLVALNGNGSCDATASLSRRSSPTVAEVEEACRISRLQRRCGFEGGLDGVGECDGSMTLCGPYNVRFAQVSSLSESLADIVSSSRSTAHSSLTSTVAAAASCAMAPSHISSAGHGSTGDAEDECVTRRSATVMDPNLSSILPDEEELAIRRRLQRGRHPLAPHTQRRRDIHGANVAASEEARHHPARARAVEGNDMEVFVACAPPTAPRDRQPLLQKEVRRPASSRYTSGISAAAGGGVAGAASEPQSVNSRTHAADVWPPRPPRPFASSSLPSPSWRTVACASRLTVALLSAMVCAWCVIAVASPLVALQPRYALSAVAGVDSAAAERQFLQTYANSVADLQALYQIAPASLDADAVVRLHHRTLSEGVERLERATQHLVPDDNASPSRCLFYLRAMIQTYLALSRNCELYARSRDRSRWRRYIGYPLADVERYGVRRFGSFSSQPFIAPSAVVAWQDRVWTTVVCSAQSEVLACPSVLYVEEAMARDAAQFVYTDSNEAHESPRRQRQLQDWRTRLRRDWGSEVYLETLLRYIRSGVQELTRDYNR
ncbi:hypothetical protein LSCM4_00183 [Leishmania orientalis]|uniref:Uncharacterized protein n=1 Tax=Leishmania orientalis TaxID=2249476 RepID=A0A836FLC1_9TRYP|nr:hypothetical protein LSCM4_00183 [Leishmania orientalis]